VAFVALFVTLGANLEIGFGLAHEGKVHHEGIVQVLAEAATHGLLGLERHAPRGTLRAFSDPASLATLRHARGLDLRATNISQPDRGHSQHEGGTCMDHCTHLHSAAVVTRVLIPIRTLELAHAASPRIDHPNQAAPSTSFRPPRA